MTRLKFMIALCIGTLVYVGMIVIAGSNGLLAYEQLYEQNEKLVLNTQKLRQTRDDLKLDYEELKTDVARTEAAARKLGYIYEGETLITINGIADAAPNVYDPGTVVKLTEIQSVPERTCKIMGLVFFAISYLFMSVIELKSRRRIIQEPAYEAEQI